MLAPEVCAALVGMASTPDQAWMRRQSIVYGASDLYNKTYTKNKFFA